jgi:hypothetical protein
MIDLKRKRALLESNSPAIGFMTVKTPQEKAFLTKGLFFCGIFIVVYG